MSGLIQVPYTPLSQTLELTKLVQSVDAFSSDVFRLTSLRSSFGPEARDFTRRVPILENEVREWDNKILLFHDVIPDTVLDKFRREAQNLTAATQAIREYFKLTICTNQEENASLAPVEILSTTPPYDVPPNTPDFDHFRMSVSSSSSSSNLSFSSYLPPIVSPSSHPSLRVSLSSAGIGSLLGSGSSSPYTTTTTPSDWSLVSGIENIRISSSGSQD